MLNRLPDSLTSWLFYCIAVLASTAIASGGEPAPLKLVIELKIIEVYTDKLKNLGFDWAQLAADGGVKHVSADRLALNIQDRLVATDGLSGFLEALRQSDLAHVLAEPTLATLDGRPASFEVGGTKLDIVPIVRGSGQVRLEYRIEIAALRSDPNRPGIKREANQTAPLLRLDAATELEMGKPCVVGHTRVNSSPNKGKNQPTELLVLARVDLIESGTLPTAARATTDAEFQESPRKTLTR